jgi:membrane fusion protein, multidrug efflux system
VEVLSGLAPGDRIVIDGADKLRDGAKIVVRTETGAGTPPAAAPDAKSGAKKRRSDDGQKQ